VRICVITTSSQALAFGEQDLFTIITCFCGFAIGFGLHLFYGVSPHGLVPFYPLLCAGGKSCNSHYCLLHRHCLLF